MLYITEVFSTKDQWLNEHEISYLCFSHKCARPISGKILTWQAGVAREMSHRSTDLYVRRSVSPDVLYSNLSPRPMWKPLAAPALAPVLVLDSPSPASLKRPDTMNLRYTVTPRRVTLQFGPTHHCTGYVQHWDFFTQMFDSHRNGFSTNCYSPQTKFGTR